MYILTDKKYKKLYKRATKNKDSAKFRLVIESIHTLKVLNLMTKFK